jgi:hypothetical protein
VPIDGMRASFLFMTTTQPRQQSNLNSKVELAFMRLLLAVLKTALLIAVVVPAQAGERRKHHRGDNRNYILRRQEAYQVQGVPTSRLIIGRRQIDVYRDGAMFEGNNLVGLRGKR